jgi:hypothetical protein
MKSTPSWRNSSSAARSLLGRAGEAVEFPDEDDVDLPLAGERDELAELRACGVRSALVLDERVGDAEAPALGEGLELAELGSGLLLVRRDPSVNCAAGAHGCSSSEKIHGHPQPSQ